MPAVSPATAGIDFQSDEHHATDFCRPDPLHRPVSSFADERARTRSLFTAVDLPMRGGPSRASTTGRALEQGDRDTPRSRRGPFRSAGGLEARK